MKQLNFGSTNGVPNDPKKTVVHCPTQELAQKVLRIADSEWCIGGKMFNKDLWTDNKDRTVYYISEGQYGGKENVCGYTILPAEEFIRLNEEVKNAFVPFVKDDRVFNYHKGWGSVIDISEPPKLLCQVDFESGECRWMDMGELSFTEYTLQGFSQERPKPEIKPGQLIYVRCNDHEWKMRFFSHFIGGCVYCFSDQERSGEVSTWIEYSLTNPLEEK